jgi:beta-glucosidase
MRFPEGFIFGTATSAFQIEGGSQTEWQRFRGDDGTLIGNAIGHYAKLKEDLDYILYLGNAYRFSMDWSRLQKGPYLELESSSVKHYEMLFKALKDNNKKVFLVLNHFANPLWMYNSGCWTNKENCQLGSPRKFKKLRFSVKNL